jgi:hypothetical protein
MGVNMYAFNYKGRRWVINGEAANKTDKEILQRRIIDMVWAEEQGGGKFYEHFPNKEAQRAQSEINWQNNKHLLT